MKITIIAVGKNRGYLGEDIVSEYSGRLEHYTKLEWKFIPGTDLLKESVTIMKIIPDNSYVILLDEKGKQLSSVSLADFLQKRLNESVKDLVVIIGGAHGVSDEIKKRANFIWALSELVFPHELVRIILSETLYRSFTIIKGEKYHHV